MGIIAQQLIILTNSSANISSVLVASSAPTSISTNAIASSAPASTSTILSTNSLLLLLLFINYW